MQLYNQHCMLRYRQTAKVIVKGAIFWLFTYLGLSLILKFDPPISRLFAVSSFIFVIAELLTWRLFFLKIVRCKPIATNLQEKVLFVGWGKEVEQLEKEIKTDSSLPYKIIGCIPSSQGRLNCSPPSSIPILGDYNDLTTLLDRHIADIVILADLNSNIGETIGLANLCEMKFAKFKVIPSYFQILASCLQLETIAAFPFWVFTK